MFNWGKMSTDILIDLVRERPVLYNTSHPLYKDRKEKEKKWREISLDLRVTSDLAKSKWRNVKDCYMKHLKGSPKYCHWQWAEQMEFMRQHLNCPPSSIPKIEQEDDDETDAGDHSTTDMQCNQSNSDLPDPLERSREGTPIRTHRLHHATTTTLNRYTPQHSDRFHPYFEEKKRKEYDPIELIFLAYAKTIQTFSVRRQAQIKLKIAKLMSEEEIEHSEETQ